MAVKSSCTQVCARRDHSLTHHLTESQCYLWWQSGGHINSVCGNIAVGESLQGKGVTAEWSHGGDGGGWGE